MKHFNCLPIGFAVLLLFVALLPGCVSKSSYEALEQENATLVEENESLRADIESLQDELATQQGQLKTTNEKLKKAEARMQLINAVFVPAMRGQLDYLTQGEQVNLFLEWRDQIKAVGDPKLSTRFEAFIDSGMSEAALIVFFVYLFESTVDVFD